MFNIYLFDECKYNFVLYNNNMPSLWMSISLIDKYIKNYY